METMLLLVVQKGPVYSKSTGPTMSQQNSENKAVISDLTFVKHVRKNNFHGHYGKNGLSP